MANVAQQGTSDLRMLEGRTVTCAGVPATESILVDAERNLRAQTFRTRRVMTEDGAVYAVRQIRILSQQAFTLDREYSLSVRMPPQLEYANPGMQRGQPAGFLLAVSEQRTAPRAIFARARAQLHAYFLEQMPGAAGGFLTALVTGERGFIPRELNQAFGVTGLAHMLSISGTHFGLVFFALFHFLRFVLLRLPERILERITLVVSPSQAAALIAVPALTLYLGISDLSYPAIRSFFMIVLFLLGLLLGRQGMWLNTLLFAACAIVAFDPDALGDLSFQLSFVAVLGIGLASDWMRSRWQEQPNENSHAPPAEAATGGSRPTLLRRCCQALAGSLLISLAATLGTAPLVAITFHYSSLISPIANLVGTPFIGFLVLPWVLAGSFSYLLFGVFPMSALLESCTKFLLGIVETCARWEWAAVRIEAFPMLFLVLFYGILALLVMARVLLPAAAGRKKAVLRSTDAAALLIILAVSFSWGVLQKRDGALITFLDTGQGDAAVIELPDQRVMVLDTGRNWQPVMNFLRFRGVRTVDALILSHAHPDHVAGFAGLQRDFRIREIWDNARLAYREPLSPELVHRRLERGDVIAGEGYAFIALHPYPGYSAVRTATEENNDSLVLKFSAFDRSVLFTGDIAVDAEENLLALGGHLKSTVLKVPHHGSRSSLSPPFLERVAPELAVISAGRNNRYGHPHAATLDALAGSRIYRTDRDGAIGVLLHRSGDVSVKTWKEESLHPVMRPYEELSNIKRLMSVW
ncbi:MAG TPA: DNA internalization-related competence protein ComEC/Rec2 [Dissulfurispiraceae bacterium]|nr:DNA internalization-related competence protein ComEC/Rec2 [Dissulfurispiraceae bacterium]